LLDNKRDQLQQVEDALVGNDRRATEMAEAIKKEASAIKLSDAWTLYLRSKSRPESGQRTLNCYKQQFGDFVEWMGTEYSDTIYMQDVNADIAEQYANHLEGRNLAPSTYNQHVRALALVWSILAKRGRLTHNPWAWDKTTKTGIRRKNRKLEAKERKRRPLSLEEVNAVIAKATGDYRTLIIILACTGQRTVDGVMLRWSDIDFKRGIITLIPRKTASYGIEVKVPLLPQLRVELESKARVDEYILPEIVAEYNRQQTDVAKQIQEIFKTAKVTGSAKVKSGRTVSKVGAHSLRHSFVSIARLAGLPDAFIMKITGHSSEEMVNHYTEFTNEFIASLSARLPQVNQKATGSFVPESTDNPPLPGWAKEKLKKMNSKNWNKIREELL